MSTELDIKKELRASMNGILSARMREAGMPFKLIFGVELPRLQSIAKDFPQDAELAKRLWSQSIREMRLLAIMLMPPETFTFKVAEEWGKTMLTAEEAQIMAMMLLPKTSACKEVCMAWIEEGKSLTATSACLCLRHLIIRGIKLNEDERLFVEDYIKKMLPRANLHLRKAIQVLEAAIEE
ncbi:MAG: DNA alkylation repair protein [Bacteroidaceae bacterium]|nr:DNA alkylation repair protein [Bacteroidaceae bacterium]MBQ8453798.1 DNA alkylation repair protein [Bacteroidaceae bacterium]MBQ9293659.1 DNA alkylation repair protein [Bacteroidaceae bacterium]